MKSIILNLSPRSALYVPFAHFDMLRGLAYKLMSYDPTLSSEIHDRRFSDKKAFKFFCFTDLSGKYHNDKKKKTLIYHNSFTWELRSADDRIIDAAEQSIIKRPDLEINRQKCDVLSYEIRHKRFCADNAEFTMNTPITVYHTEESGFRRYYHPFEQEFFDGLVKNIQNKYEMFYEKTPLCDVNIVCKVPSDKDKCVTRSIEHGSEQIVNAWYGNYLITASPEVLDFIWHTGIGGKNASGFGTVIERNQ